MASNRLRRRKAGERFQILPQGKERNRNPEVLPWYWNPDRGGALPAPDHIAAKLKEIDPDLRLVRSPVHERWLLWVKNPRIGFNERAGAAYWLCRGWQLLFIFEKPAVAGQVGEEIPLGDGSLLFANIFKIAAQHYPNAQVYYDKIVDEQRRVKEAKEKDYANEVEARQADFHDSTRISSAGRGNRFALHHGGDFIPSPGHLKWMQDTRRQRLPADAIQQEKDDKERARYGS